MIDDLSGLADPYPLADTYFGRLISAFPSALVTTYRHRPLVGLVRTGHPNGLEQDYAYDEWGRLQSVFTDGHKRQENTYHYTNVAAPPLSVTFEDTSSSYGQGEHSFSIKADGGSGTYEYRWSLAASDGTTVASSSDTTLVYTFGHGGNYTLSCVVTDLITREQVEKRHSFNIERHRVYFSEIIKFSFPSTGEAKVTAVVNCQVPTEVTFRLDYRVIASMPTTRYECRIGNYFEKNSGRKWKDFTLSLPAGGTAVSLSLHDIIAYSEVELSIQNVMDNGSTVGSPNTLFIDL